MKRIVICADGTWNSPEQDQPSNVLRLARGIKPQAAGVKQICFYDWGVGSDRLKLAGGISGAGINKNIMDCYRFLMHNYEAGDELFFFGFSRGAYTVRSLAGFIRNSGLLRREHGDKVADAFNLYRKRGRASSPDAPAAKAFRQSYAVAYITPIEFVGVWDTVGALGIPVPFWGTLGEREYLFHDTEPSKIIRHARHALAIDENREDFAPALWQEKEGIDLIQLWFAGVHSDIGGGYREQGLSDCALKWMLQEASAFGLQLESHLLQSVKPNALDRQHNERKGIYRARPNFTRNITGPLHTSVKHRWNQDTQSYQTKSKALKKRLEQANDDWSQLKIIS